MVKFYMILHDPDVLCCHESDPHHIRPFLVKNSLSTKGNTGNTGNTPISDTALNGIYVWFHVWFPTLEHQ